MYPFIFTTARTSIREAVAFDNQRGITSREIEGEHAIWAARIPFLPAMLSDDFTRLGTQRIPFVRERQFRFIYDLARLRENRATFELRFVATPNPVPGQPSLIDIVFFGKVFSARARNGARLAERLWDRFISIFPLEDPFNYPLEPIVDEADFSAVYEPFPFDDLTTEDILEIRKYEDMPIRPTAPIGRIERQGDYIAHPFIPNVDFSPMGRFFAALASQPARAFAAINLRPTRMFDQEVFNVSFAIGRFKKTLEENDEISGEYVRSRAGIGVYVYQELMDEREQLVTVRVHVIGEQGAPVGLAEALGSEMMGNAKSLYPTLWAAARPADEREHALAVSNIRHLEQDVWGHTIATPSLERLRYFATAREAYGAFRLPVPAESGYMPGVLVKSEPFVAPADELELRLQARANLDDVTDESSRALRQPKVTLGTVYHRGTQTPQPFRVNVRDLTRHALIAGSTGSGKTTTIKHLLRQLWVDHQVPFLVLYPIDKPDYRDLGAVPGLGDDLLIFTLGDESTSPFRFNPFEVPDGLLLKTHLSRLMRVFSAAFTLQDPLPMVYREALRRVYRDKGWDVIRDRGDRRREYPIMSELHTAIRQITDSLEYGREVKDNVRQASVIRIGDLLENAGHTVNVRRSMSLARVLERPTVMEIGRVGSPQDTALLMGFLLMRFAEEVERSPRPADHPHVTVVEEAHRLMAETGPHGGLGADARGSAGEDFSNILAELRGFGEGIVIAEQIPTLLVKAAIGNTFLKVMHWLEDVPSFELFAGVMNLNGEQREYARTLTPGFAIVRSPYGRPVHMKVPDADDRPAGPGARPVDSTDDGIRSLMRERRAAVGIDEVEVTPWELPLAASDQAGARASAPVSAPATAPAPPARVTERALTLALSAPMQTCAFCRPLHETGTCKYGRTVRRRLLPDEPFLADRRTELRGALAEADVGARWGGARAMLSQVEQRVASLADPDRRGIAYCFLAHLVDEAAAGNGAAGEEDTAEQERTAAEAATGIARARGLLQQFENRYRSVQGDP